MNYGIFFCQKVTCAKRGKTIIKYIYVWCVCVISLPVSLDQQVACVLFLLFGGFTGIMFVYYAYICNTWVHSEAAIFTYVEPFDDKRTSSRTRTHRHTHTHTHKQAQLNGRPQEKQQRQQQTANGKWQPKRKPKTAANNCAASRLRQRREAGKEGEWEWAMEGGEVGGGKRGLWLKRGREERS